MLLLLNLPMRLVFWLAMLFAVLRLPLRDLVGVLGMCLCTCSAEVAARMGERMALMGDEASAVLERRLRSLGWLVLMDSLDSPESDERM